MISYYTILTVLLCHYIFDFHLQTDEMAKNKSKCNFTLLQHCLIYGVGIVVLSILNFDCLGKSPDCFFGFIFANFALHFLTDFVTSRATSPLFGESRFHDGFAVVGADQLIHYATLFGTFIYFTK